MARLTEDRISLNRKRILTAGAQAFSRSGYNGVTVRDIAKKTKLPLGSLYNYYEDKLALFRAVIADASGDFLSDDNELIRYFLTSKFPDDLPRLASAIKESIETHETYFKLMYVDVIEFEGKHIRETFSNLEPKFREAMAGRFKEIGFLGRGRKIDPAFALVSIYLSFYQYFLMTKLFGASKIFGARSEHQVVSGLIEIFQHGIEGKWN